MRIIDSALFETVAAQAAATPRRRMNHNFHSGPEDNPHRFLNVLLEGTYVRPHRHLDPPKSEAFLVLEGEAAIVCFDDAGHVTSRTRIGPASPAIGIDLEPGLFHTVIALSPRAVCYEVKPGPWNPANDKDFASWAPAEGTPEAAAYLAGLVESLRRG